MSLDAFAERVAGVSNIDYIGGVHWCVPFCSWEHPSPARTLFLAGFFLPPGRL
jgi:hypothetical protein